MIIKLYNTVKDESKKQLLSKKVLSYAKSEFGYKKVVDAWHDSMLSTIENFKNRKSWFRKTF